MMQNIKKAAPEMEITLPNRLIDFYPLPSYSAVALLTLRV